MKQVIIIALLAFAALAVFLRQQAPNGVSAHVEPGALADLGHGGVRLIGDAAPVFEVPADTVLAAFLQVARAHPRTELLAGSVDDGMVTVVVRSRVFAFQDYITAQAVPEDGATRLHVAARTRYPRASDWGVNRNRLEQWLLEIAERVGQAG